MRQVPKIRILIRFLKCKNSNNETLNIEFSNLKEPHKNESVHKNKNSKRSSQISKRDQNSRF